MTKFLEFMDLKRDRLENVLASIVFGYLVDGDVCRIGRHLIEKKIVKFLSLVEMRDTREVIRRQVKKVLRRDRVACLEFLDGYIEERCIFKGGKALKIDDKEIEVKIKDEIKYLNGSEERGKNEIYFYLNDNKFVIEVPSEVCISSRCDMEEGSYYEERKRFFVERCKVRNEEELVDGLVLVSRNREFSIGFERGSGNKRNSGGELDVVDRGMSRVRDSLEVCGFIVVDERNGFRYIPYNRKFRGGYLFFAEVAFRYGFLKVVDKKKVVGLS